MHKPVQKDLAHYNISLKHQFRPNGSLNTLVEMLALIHDSCFLSSHIWAQYHFGEEPAGSGTSKALARNRRSPSHSRGNSAEDGSVSVRG